MFRTRHGLNLRAVGENPAAADAAGISVNLIRFCYVAAGSALAAGAGAYLTLAFVPSWSDGVVAGRGWIAGGSRNLRRLPADPRRSGRRCSSASSPRWVSSAKPQLADRAGLSLSMLPYLGTMRLHHRAGAVPGSASRQSDGRARRARPALLSRCPLDFGPRDKKGRS